MANNSTKDLVEIADIQGNVVLLKNGSLRAIIEVSAINFELRSEAEQIGIVQNFQNFLNSADFPIQIIINSRQLNMEEYLQLLSTTAASLTNELLKIQATEYGKFVKELLELSNIMSKKFYVVLPFYIYETPTRSGLLQSVKSILKPSSIVQKINVEEIQKYQAQLMQRVELILDGLTGLGVKTRLLEGPEIQNIFFGLYNPGETLNQKQQ